MKLFSIQKFTGARLGFATLLAMTALVRAQADGITLDPGSSVSVANSNLSAYTPDGSFSTDFSVGGIQGKLFAYAFLPGVLENELGGVTFVYELQNLSQGGSEGISFLDVSGWLGVNTMVARGRVPFTENYNGPLVRPGNFSRDESGETISFSFPPGSEEPPIFAGENAYQLIVFTDATAWSVVTGQVKTDDFTVDKELIPDTGNWVSVNTFGVHATTTTVPDGGSTALLAGLVLLALIPLSARRK